MLPALQPYFVLLRVDLIGGVCLCKGAVHPFDVHKLNKSCMLPSVGGEWRTPLPDPQAVSFWLTHLSFFLAAYLGQKAGWCPTNKVGDTC